MRTPYTVYEVMKIIALFSDKEKAEIVKQLQQTSAIDWKELRDKFFNECTDEHIHSDITKQRTINLAPHDQFEWIHKEIEQQLNKNI